MWSSSFAYLGASALSVFVLVWVMQLWKADLSVPFYVQGDAILFQVWIKGMIDNGWYLHNDYLGAPTSLDLQDFNQFDTLHFAFLKCLSWVHNHPPLILNLYLLLTFPLTVISSLFVLRRLRIGYGPAITVSLLYAFLPYHFLRMVGHPLLAAYYHVPLLALVCLWIYLDRTFLFKRTGKGEKLKLLSRQSLGAVVICVLGACGGVYYAFFACYFFLVAGAAAALRWRRWPPLAAAGLCIAVVCAAGLINATPTLVYRWQHGANHAFYRDAAEAEVYGLKLAQLLLPIDHHRLSFLARIKTKYYDRTPLNNENTYAALGLFGSVGFLILLIHLFRPSVRVSDPPRRCADEESARRDALIGGLALFNGAAFFLGTIGGFASLFALLVTPWIRSYNRISIYIAFFALCAVAVVMDAWARKCRSRQSCWAFRALLAVIILSGIADQTSPGIAVPDYGGARAVYRRDQDFARKIEALLPPTAWVFQLPSLPFPEALPVEGTLTYDPGRPYLHTRRLHWSYGKMKGRPAYAWEQTLVSRPPEEVVRLLARAGFHGLYVDRAGYPDFAAHLIRCLKSELQAEPLVSEDQRFVFYDLTNYAAAIRTQYSAEQWEAQRKVLLEALPPSLQIASRSRP